MAQTQYQLHLKGYVGGYDFDADYVDYILAKNAGKEVHVLIDSLGGQSSTALSIFSAFRRHGNVNAHFVGMNASAATIASLGAKRITMDSSAMYLVHKCSIAFFEWGHLNADDLQALITNIEHQKKDLDKLDANIAQMYATRCKNARNSESRTKQLLELGRVVPGEDEVKSAELLALMKEGGWLTAQEALLWGFVDELTDYEEETAPVLNDTTVQALANAGIPIPNLPRATAEQSAFARFLNALTGMFRNHEINKTTSYNTQAQSTMKKIFTCICAILACDHLLSEDGKITLEDGQLDTLEKAMSSDKKTIQSLNDKITSLEEEKKSLTDAKSALETEIADLKKKPADTSSHVIDDNHNEQSKEKSVVDNYFDSRANAKNLFNLLP